MKYLPFFKEYLNTFEMLDAADHLPLLKALCDHFLDGKEPTGLSKQAELAFKVLAYPINKSVELREIRSAAGKRGKGVSRNLGNQNARKHPIKTIQNNTESIQNKRKDEGRRMKEEVRTEELSTSPTPPPMQPTSAPSSLTPVVEPPSGSGGGGVVGKPMSVRPWPTRAEFQTWLNEVCVKLGGLLPDDGYRNLLATFDQMTDRGRIDSNGRRVQNWQLFFGKIARKEAEKWRVPELIVA